MSIATLGLGLAYINKLYRLVKENSIDDKSFMTKYKGVYKMYKDKESAIFECITTLKKFLFSFFLVFLNGFHPLLQLSV